jgi:DNA-binding LacI/PurR family transcriptional regulator
LTGSAYAATLAGFIQKLLTEKSCRCLTFYQNSSPTDSPCPALAEFPGLEQAVFEGRCDGIISLCPFSPADQKKLYRSGVPCCFIGDDDLDAAMPLAVVIEVKRFIADAANALKKSGCRNIIQLCASDEQLARRGKNIPALVGNSYDGGEQIAATLLNMEPSQRPDGIISDDDTIVSGVLAGLLIRQLPDVDYIPQIATIVHAELGERYPSNRMILFQQNIENYADMAVKLLLDVLRGDQPEETQLFYRFKPVR